MIPRHGLVAASVLLAVLVAGCSAGQPVTPAPVPAEPSSAPPPTSATPTPAAESATDAADRIVETVDSAGDVTTITEDNDPNDLLGRPGGYVDAAVIEDEAGDCAELGIGCGASVEVWPSEVEAQERADYITEQLDANPAFGTEYHTLSGVTLLRVAGAVKPSVAEEYAAAFQS